MQITSQDISSPADGFCQPSSPKNRYLNALQSSNFISLVEESSGASKLK
jgi:hypothetical protein